MMALELARSCGDGHWINAVVGLGIGGAGLLGFLWWVRRG